jgi:hypothetical protein
MPKNKDLTKQIDYSKYHRPLVPWTGTHLGRTWRTTPGQDDDMKKMNFALLRRGLFDLNPPKARRVDRIFGGALAW